MKMSAHFSMRLLPRCAAMLVAFVTAGCDRANEADVNNKLMTADTSSASRNRCYVTFEGRRMLIGNPECLRKLPARRMSGVWVLGHEYSVFHEGATGVLPVNPSMTPTAQDVWLEADPDLILPRYGKSFDGETHQYLIEFVGTKSDAPGYYGDGLYKRGALVLKVVNLQQLG